VPIDILRNKTPRQVYDDVRGFSQRYVQDWTIWLDAPQPGRPELFGKILRKWQATRPRAMRRLRADRKATHTEPFLDDLLDKSATPIAELGDLSIVTIGDRTDTQNKALSSLWQTFTQLQAEGTSTCVGITKAVLLLTDGRIGPAFDSQVRKKLRIAPPATCSEWLVRLEEIADDILAFEAAHESFASAVPEHFAHLAYGRLYDMALGPR
jgi:hypothetical protein